MVKPGARIILAARFLFFCMEIGLAKSFGVLVPELEEQLQTSNAIVGFITSLSLAMTYLGSPIAKMLLHRCSKYPRVLTSFCGLAAGCSLISISFTRNIALMGVLFISVGLCCSVVNLQALILLHEYYKDDDFAFVSCISVLGIPFGAAVLPLVTEKLLDQYGMSGTLMIVGAMVLNMLPIGMVLKPPRTCRPPSGIKNKEVKFESLSTTLPGETDDNFNEFNQISSVDKVRDNADAEFAYHDLNNGASANANSGNKHVIRNNTYVAIRNEPESPSERCHGSFDELAVNPPQDGNDTIDSLSTKEESEIPLQDSSTFTEATQESGSIVLSCLSYFYLDVIIKEPLFSIFYFPSVVLLFLVTGGWALFVVLYAVEHGIDIARGTYLATSGATGGIFASILVSIGLHYRPEWSPQYWIVTNILYALMLFLQTLSSSYGYLLASSFLIGFGLFAVNTDLEAVLCLVVKKENFADAGNLFFLAIGIGYIASGYVSGFVQDQTGDIKILFLFLGVMSTIGLVLITTMVIIFRRTSATRRRDSNVEEHLKRDAASI